MKVGTVSTYLHLVHMKKKVLSRKKEGGDGQETSWMGQVAKSRHPLVLKREVNTLQGGAENHAARLEQLREQIRAGSYVIDSRALAKSILANETHFLEGRQE